MIRLSSHARPLLVGFAALGLMAATPLASAQVAPGSPPALGGSSGSATKAIDPDLGLPVPIADTLTSVSAVSSTDVWALGTLGETGPEPFLLHFNGTAWSRAPLPKPAGLRSGDFWTLASVSADASDDVWVVGSLRKGSSGSSPSFTVVEHYDGSSWSLVSVPRVGSNDAFDAVSALSASDVWVAGSWNEGALAEHFDGSRWTQTPVPTYLRVSSISASSATNAWAVATGGGGQATSQVLRWNGTRWTRVTTGIKGTFSRAATVSSNEAWVIGTHAHAPIIGHFDGGHWSVTPGATLAGRYVLLSSIAASGPDHAWAVGASYADAQYVPQAFTERWDGTAWHVVPVPTPGIGPGSDSLADVVALSGTSAFAVGSFSTQGIGQQLQQTLAERWDGSAWARSVTPSPGEEYAELAGTGGTGPDDEWAVGDNATAGTTLIEHHVASGWSVVASPNAVPPPGANALAAVSADATDDAWAVGSYQASGSDPQLPLAEHWDGRTWTVVSTPSLAGTSAVFSAVDVIAPDDAWAVGYGDGLPLIEHWNGTHWTVKTFSGALEGMQLTGVTSSASDDVWAVGSYTFYSGGTYVTDSLAVHNDGSAWSIVSTPNPGGFYIYDPLDAVTAISPTDVWAVGASSGQLMTDHWDGTSWTATLVAGTQSTVMTGVSATDADDVWVSGWTYPNDVQQTLAAHYDGTSWTVVPTPSPGRKYGDAQLAGIAAWSPDDAWAVGKFAPKAQPQATLTEHWDGTRWTQN